MRPWPRLAMLLLVALCVSNVACWWLKKPARATCPTAPPPLPTASEAPRTASPAPHTAAAPHRAASAPPHTAAAPRRAAPAPPHTAAAPHRAASSSRRGALPPRRNAATKPNPAGHGQEQRETREQPKAPENDPPPSLGQMFSREERAELTQSLDRNLSNAREAMSRLSGHALTPDQSQTVNLVQSLLAQADKARHADLAVAAQLARRADVLARDLCTSVR